MLREIVFVAPKLLLRVEREFGTLESRLLEVPVVAIVDYSGTDFIFNRERCRNK